MNATYQTALDFYTLCDKPSQTELDEYYAQKYFQESKSKAYAASYSEQELRLFRQKLEQRYAAICACQDTFAYHRFLDVGCGEGFALQFFAERGYEVKGLDYSRAGIEQHHPLLVGSLVEGDVFASLQAEIAAGQRYDIIWLQHVLEHVLEPMTLLQQLKSLVAPGGVLVVTVPNDFSALQQKALEEGRIDRSFWIAVPDHISYFNTHSIDKVVAHTGWRLLDKMTDFPIDWFLFHQQTNYVQNPALGKPAHQARMALEDLIAENPPEAVNAFYRALANIGMGRSVTVILAH